MGSAAAAIRAYVITYTCIAASVYRAAMGDRVVRRDVGAGAHQRSRLAPVLGSPGMRQVRFPGESHEARRARALRERVDDLRVARQRIIAAADAERRRIERDLHDGAQQRMVALAVTLGLAESKLESDPALAAKLVAQAREEAQLAVKELRELARGIHPALLSERGLGVALAALAARAPVPTTVDGVPVKRLPPP